MQTYFQGSGSVAIRILSKSLGALAPGLLKRDKEEVPSAEHPASGGACNRTAGLRRAGTGTLAILQLHNANIMSSLSRVPAGHVELYVPAAARGCRSRAGRGPRGQPGPAAPAAQAVMVASQKVLTDLLLKYPKLCKPSLGLPEALRLSLLSLPLWANRPSCCQMWPMPLTEEGGPQAWHSRLSPSGLEQPGIVFPNGFIGL